MALRRLSPGWFAALLVWVWTAYLVSHFAHVSVPDVLAFTGYVLGWLLLPGTLLWRAVDPRGGPGSRRPLAEDLALGLLVGYVAEFPVYLGCLALGHPRLLLAWPLLVVVLVLAGPWRRGLLHGGSGPMPRRWSWGVALGLGYLSLRFAHLFWSSQPVTPTALRSAYVDQPYHLSLATSLRHFFPPQVSFVAGTPMRYHWLSHLHVAAASWVSGVEPVVLLSALAIPTAVLAAALGLAVAATRLTRSWWTGPVAVGMLLIGPIRAVRWAAPRAESFDSNRLMLSPSAGFVNVALVLGVLLCVELLSGLGEPARRRWPAWCLAGLVLVAMAGAKSTALPVVGAAAVGAAIVAGVARRRVHRAALTLVGLSVLAYVVAVVIFFGAGTHGLAVGPSSRIRAQAMSFAGLLDGSGRVPTSVLVMDAAAYYLPFAAIVVGSLALLVRGGRARAENVFLVLLWPAGAGASLVFSQSSSSEYYFLYVAWVPLALAGTVGLHHAAALATSRAEPAPGRRSPQSKTTLAAVASVAVGGLLCLLVRSVTTAKAPVLPGGSPVVHALLTMLLPPGLAVALALTVAAGVALVGRRRSSGPPALLVLVCLFVGLGSSAPVASGLEMASHPFPPPRLSPVPGVGRGGLEAARWIRQHTSVDTVLATNAHRHSPGGVAPRNFWMAAYSERRFLVEGWAYVSRASVGLPAPAEENVTLQPFWDQALLQRNDAVFFEPTRARLEELRAEYGVSLLLVDLSYPVARGRLVPLTDVVHRSGQYLVLRLR